MGNEEEIRRQIREKTKDGYILEEMIRLGFWPKEGEMPVDPADEIRRRAKLKKELTALRTEDRRAHNISLQLRELKKRRLKESGERRQENKKRRLEEKKQRARDWQEKQEKDIIYLGEDVSKCLNNNLTEWNLLESNQLPVFREIEELAQALELSVRELRFLAFNRKVSKISHYRRFKLPKKSGGERSISAPRSYLKRTQNWILHNLLYKIPFHQAAHGFKPNASIITNAQVHCSCKFLINIDLENFFPTFTYKRVKGMFKSLGYSHKISTILTLLTTEPEIEEMILDDETWYVATGQRHLPQGSPASPAITNIICRSLDNSLTRLAVKYGLKYSRYADDMSFSSQENPDKKAVGQFMRQLGYIVAKAGLKINRKKTRIVREGGCREVTGLLVHNDKPHISQKKLKAFKTVLFQLEKDGPAGKSWGNSDNIFAAIHGYAHFINMVDQEKGKAFLYRVNALLENNGWQPEKKSPISKNLNPLLKESIEEIVEETIEENLTIDQLNSLENKSPDNHNISNQEAKKKKPWWMFWKFW